MINFLLFYSYDSELLIIDYIIILYNILYWQIFEVYIMLKISCNMRSNSHREIHLLGHCILIDERNQWIFLVLFLCLKI